MVGVGVRVRDTSRSWRGVAARIGIGWAVEVKVGAGVRLLRVYAPG